MCCWTDWLFTESQLDVIGGILSVWFLPFYRRTNLSKETSSEPRTEWELDSRPLVPQSWWTWTFISLFGYHFTTLSLHRYLAPYTTLQGSLTWSCPLSSSRRLVTGGRGMFVGNICVPSWYQTWSQPEPCQDPSGDSRKMGLVHNSKKSFKVPPVSALTLKVTCQ